MIKFRLRCDQGHEFDSMFNNSAAFDKLARAKQLVCEHCGSHEISKAIMAPAVRSSDRAARIAELDAVRLPAFHELPFVGDLREVVDAAEAGDETARAKLTGTVAGTVSSFEDLLEVAKHGEVYIEADSAPATQTDGGNAKSKRSLKSARTRTLN